MSTEKYTLILGDDEVLYFPKHSEDKNKYIVFTCAKNENEYIREWIEHYKSLNFDKIIICDNNDDLSLMEVISDYIDSGFVEIFDCRGVGSFQVQIYSMFCSEGNYKWCAYFDCDEFLELGLYSDIKEYLSTKSGEICISFNWMLYGSNEQLFKTEGGVQERFKYPTSPISLYTENCYIKSIVRGGNFFKNDCWFNGSHMPTKEGTYKQCIGGYFWKFNNSHQILPPRYKEGYIKHYYTKSFEEWTNKSKRGWPDGTEHLLNYRYFVAQDWVKFPFNEMRNSLFIDRITEDYQEIIDTYDVIHLVNPSKYMCAYMVYAYDLMSRTKGHTFIISGEHIDDTVYNMLLEYGLNTDNRVVWANSDDDVWRAYCKYTDGRSDTYYILYF